MTANYNKEQSISRACKWGHTNTTQRVRTYYRFSWISQSELDYAQHTFILNKVCSNMRWLFIYLHCTFYLVVQGCDVIDACSHPTSPSIVVLCTNLNSQFLSSFIGWIAMSFTSLIVDFHFIQFPELLASFVFTYCIANSYMIYLLIFHVIHPKLSHHLHVWLIWASFLWRLPNRPQLVFIYLGWLGVHPLSHGPTLVFEGMNISFFLSFFLKS